MTQSTADEQRRSPPDPDLQALVHAWLGFSRMKRLPLSSIIKSPDRLDALFRGLLLAAANAVDDKAGRVNFRRRLASFLSRFGGWLAADAEALMTLMIDCGVISVTGQRVQVQMRLPPYRADALTVFTARLSAEIERERRERDAKRIALQRKNRTIHQVVRSMPDAADNDDIMKEALEEARGAAARGEVPVGAVVVVDGNIVARAGNRVRELKDPTAHAEILAIRRACAVLGNERLTDAVLYVTLEPCAMCAAAAAHARIGCVVWGADDAERGGLKSTVNVPKAAKMTTQPAGVGGVRACECTTILKDFFLQKRRSRREGS